MLQGELEKGAFERPGYRIDFNIKTYIKEWDLGRWTGFMCLRTTTNKAFLPTADPTTRGAISLTDERLNEYLKQILLSS